jgi:hypothetical protein
MWSQQTITRAISGVSCTLDIRLLLDPQTISRIWCGSSVEQLTTFLERQAPDDPAQSPLALPVEQMDQGEKDDLQQADPLSGDKATLSASSTTVQEGTPQSRSFHREEHP